MGVISLDYVVSYSSQDNACKVENLLRNPGGGKPWLCSPYDKTGRLEAEFQLDKVSYIDFIDIGNCGSSTIEVQVGRSAFQSRTRYTSLLPAITLMTLADIKEGVDRTAVYMFNKSNFTQEAAAEKWDRVKVICCQPFKKQSQFGLTFLSLRSRESTSQLSITDEPSVNGRVERPLSKQFRREGPVRDDQLLLTRGRRLLNVSLKSRHSNGTLKHVQEAVSHRYEEDVSSFLIVWTGDDGENKSLEDLMLEFEEQRQQKLDSSEKHVFRNKYLEIFHGNVFTSELDQSDFHSERQSSRSGVHPHDGDERQLNYGTDLIVKSPDSSPIIKPKRPRSLNYRGQSGTNSAIPMVDLTEHKPTKPKTLNFFKRSDSNNNVLRLDSPELPTFDIRMSSPVKRKSHDLDTESKHSKKSSKSVSPCDLLNTRPEDFIQFDGILPSTSSGVMYVDCPICRESFVLEEIENHAATCGDLAASGGAVEREEDVFCPICNDPYPKEVMSEHVDVCVLSH